MGITLTPDLEKAIAEQARQQGTTVESLALQALREQFLTLPAVQPRDEWENRLLGAASNCGISLSHSALSSEGLYE